MAKITILFAHLLIVQPIKLTLKHTQNICCVVFYHIIGYCIVITMCNKEEHFAHPSAKFSSFLPEIFLLSTCFNRYFRVSGEIFVFNTNNRVYMKTIIVPGPEASHISQGWESRGS